MECCQRARHAFIQRPELSSQREQIVQGKDKLHFIHLSLKMFAYCLQVSVTVDNQVVQTTQSFVSLFLYAHAGVSVIIASGVKLLDHRRYSQELLKAGIHPEKWVIRQFCCSFYEHRMNKPRWYSYYIPGLRGIQLIASRLQACTACYCSEYCKQLQQSGICVFKHI